MNNLNSVLPLSSIPLPNTIEFVKNVTYFCVERDWNANYVNIDGQNYLANFFDFLNSKEALLDETHSFNRDCNSLLENAKEPVITVDKAIILHIYTSEPGHEFALIIQLLYIYDTFKLHDYDIVLSRTAKNLGNSISSIVDTLFGSNKIHYVNNCEKVFINNSVIYWGDSIRNSNWVNNLNMRLQNFRLKTNKYDKICFIKTSNSKNLHFKRCMFDESYVDYFSSKGYVFIDPAGYNVIDLFNLIQDAKNIIFTWGSGCYINSSYCNENNNVMVLCHCGYEHEYVTDYNHVWLPVVCNRLVMTKGLTSDPIDNDVKALFDKKLLELEEGTIE